MNTYWQEYKSKLVSADKAVAVVNSGDWIGYGHMALSPQTLDAALAQQKDRLNNVNIWAVGSYYKVQTASVDPKYHHFIYNNAFLSVDDRKLGDRCLTIPALYGNGPRMIRSKHAPHIRVAMLMTTPMDKHGYFNFSISCSYHRALCDVADLIIVETNRFAPVCLGGEQECLHISEVDYIVEGDRPLVTFPQDIPVSEVEKKIGELVVEEIEDGCTLQLGIGALANYIGKLIADSDIKDLGMHSEMMCDAFMDLYEKGRITGKYKVFDKYKMTYTFAMGSQRLYDFLHHNPVCCTYPVDITNNHYRIAKNYQQISINNALLIDIYGQICSEALDFKQISGTGGQVDFTYGASLSQGGKSFMCLPATKTLKDGTRVSRILPNINPGTFITTPRTMPMYIVTEYGKANIMGKPVWQRAEQIIQLAAPEFRDELIKAAQEQKIWTKTNKIV